MHEARDAAGYEYLSTDIKFTRDQLWKFPVTALNAGLAAGLLGIGGGMVIGPLFIEIGMQPQVHMLCARIRVITNFFALFPSQNSQ
jgi:uncharacterized membrane protein YfcA